MRLSAEQLRQFDELGYLFFPNCFSDDEIGRASCRERVCLVV